MGDDYTTIPDASDLPAYIHDKDFDHLNMHGGGDAFLNPKAVTPNVKLVNSEVKVALTTTGLTRIRATAVVVAIGAATLIDVGYNFAKEAIKPIDNQINGVYSK